MSYKLNDVSIETYGAKPVFGNQKIALEGFFDMPQRIGATSKAWGTSIEHFTDSLDIELSGRNLILNVIISGELNLDTKINSFKTACMNCIKLSTNYADFNVKLVDGVKVIKYDTFALISATFYENKVSIPTTFSIIKTTTGKCIIDGYGLQADFGMFVEKIEGIHDMPKRIDIKTSEFYDNSQYRESKELTMKVICSFQNQSTAYSNVKQFHKLISDPGFRVLNYFGYSFEVYFKDGFKCDFVTENVYKFTAKCVVK